MSPPIERPRRLIVLTPGFRGRCTWWAHLKEQLAKEVDGFSSDEAQWLDFDHRSGLGSTGSVDTLAKQLHGRIVAQWLHADGFDEVVLVGHSMGGLIVRQAYLLASGAVPGEEPAVWGQRVSRIILLASINRGIDTDRTLGIRFLAWLTRLIPFLPHLRMQDVLRGSNVLTSLRINWIRHFGALAYAERQGEKWPDGQRKKPPLVVQLLGSRDGLVHEDDSKDVLAFPGGHYLRVPDADHATLYKTESAPDPALRFSVLKQGFAGDFPEGPAARAARNLEDDPIKRIVFLLHGIRASNVDEWIGDLKQRINARDPEHTEVRHPTYGYFTAARFALRSVRRKNIRVFQDWYTEALAEHPNAEFHIIAHSNGTYILGQSLLATPGMKFVNVALAGSVLPRNFPWGKLKSLDQATRVRNDRANRDWPVALMCSALRGLLMKDVGTGGFSGFEGNATDEIAYFPGGHGTALTPLYQDSLVDFVFGNGLQKPATLKTSPGFFRQLSNAMPYLAIILAGLIIAGLLVVVTLGSWPWLFASAVAAVGVYIVLDII